MWISNKENVYFNLENATTIQVDSIEVAEDMNGSIYKYCVNIYLNWSTEIGIASVVPPVASAYIWSAN